jgi:thioredoxin 1
MEGDEELERIRQKKLREMMHHSPKRNGDTSQNKDESALQKPVEVTDATFMETIRTHSLVVVDCWAPWCGPCHMVSPIIEEMARDYMGRILFGKLNVDENRNVAMQYRIMSIPTLLVFKKGQLVDQIIGAMPRHMLEPKIIQHL